MGWALLEQGPYMANSSKPALEGSTQYKNRHGFQMLFFFPCGTRWVLNRYPPSIMEEMTMGFKERKKNKEVPASMGIAFFEMSTSYYAL